MMMIIIIIYKKPPYNGQQKSGEWRHMELQKCKLEYSTHIADVLK